MATITYLTVNELGEMQRVTTEIPDPPNPFGPSNDAALMTASEDILAGAFVSIWNDGGNFRIRPSTASNSSGRADGYVLDSILAGDQGAVYFEGSNTKVTGVAPGPVYLGVNPGSHSVTPPTTPGSIIQRIGIGVNPTTINVELSTPIIRM